MKKIHISIMSLFMLTMVISPLAGQNQHKPIQTTIDEIWENPNKFIDKTVSVQGIVIEFTEESSETNSFYLLKGKYDKSIQVKVQFEEPEIGEKYIITGTVYPLPGLLDAPFIHQSNIEKIDDFFVWGQETATVTPPVENTTKVIIEDEPKDMLLYVIIIAIVVVVIIIIVLVVMRMKQSKPAAPSYVAPAPTPAPMPAPAPQPVSSADDFKTIKIVREDSRTLKFIPGHLEITTGEDRGKTLRMSGFPTSEGSVITLGRMEVAGERQFAHIAIDQKFRTVGRFQAEFIYKDNENKLYVKNLSKVNQTRIDGTELAYNEMAEVKNGSVISTGEIDFRYVL